MQFNAFLHLLRMKHLVLSIFTLFTLSISAQAPSIDKLASLFKDQDTAGVKSYAKSLGYIGYGLGFPSIGNTYFYEHYSFSKNNSDASRTISYSYGQDNVHEDFSLKSIWFFTNLKMEFDWLVDEIKTLGATEILLPPNADKEVKEYTYKGVTINTRNDIKSGQYSVGIGGWR